MSAGAAPAKAVAVCVKAVALATIFRDPSLDLSTLHTELLAPHGVSAASGAELISGATKALALAAHGNLTAAELASCMERLKLSAPLREALSAYWRDNRDGAHAFLAAAAASGRPALAGVRWRIATATASDSSADATGAVADAPSRLTLELDVLDAASRQQRTVTASLTKEQLADALASLESARREIEAVASEA